MLVHGSQHVFTLENINKAEIEGLFRSRRMSLTTRRRDDRGWTLSAAHADAVPAADLDGPLASADVRLARARQNAELIVGLPYSHTDMVRLAVEKLRQGYLGTPDPTVLLPESFTLKDLRDLHAVVAGAPLMHDSFRRLMEPQLTGTGGVSDSTRGRPSRLWSVAGSGPLRPGHGNEGWRPSGPGNTLF